MFLKLPQPPECTRPQQPRLHRTPKPSQLPFTSSLHPIWLAPPRSLGQGVVESSLAFLANDAPPPHSLTLMHTHTHTLLFTDQLLLSGLGPSGCPSLGRKPNRHLPLPTCSSPLAHRLEHRGPPTLRLAGTPPDTHIFTQNDGTDKGKALKLS